MVADLYQTFHDLVKQDGDPSIHRIAGGLEKKCELAHTRLYYFCEPQTVAGTEGLSGLSRDWGSCRGGDFGERVIGGVETLPEAGAERAVVDGAADLEQPVGATPRPAHLLRFVHATIDEEVGRALGQRRANPQPGPVPFAVVDQPIALPDEVAVQRLQRGLQLARGRDGSAAAGLATEGVHHRADAIDADLRIF